MKTSSRWLLPIGCVGLLTVLALPPHAYADSVTFTGPSTITLTEDGSSPIFLYTLTNPASGTTLNNLRGLPIIGSSTGDITEIELINFGLGGTEPCGITLAPGRSCTASLRLTLPDGTGETDEDSETFGLVFGLAWDGNPVGLTENVTITVNDTPEPSLVGTGLLGLTGMGLYKKRLA